MSSSHTIMNLIFGESILVTTNYIMPSSSKSGKSTVMLAIRLILQQFVGVFETLPVYLLVC